MTLTLIPSLCFDQLPLNIVQILRHAQPFSGSWLQDSSAIVGLKSDATKAWDLGRERTAAAPFPKSRASYFRLLVIFSRLAQEPGTGYIILVSYEGVSRMSYFLPGHLWRGRKYISPKNACLRHSRHALMCLQFIRENENSTHFCSKLLAKNGFYFSVLFDFCWLFTRVWTGCIVFSFPPFALDSCFLLFPCAAHFSLFPALFT